MFTEFIKSLERPGNETLIEAILEGYSSIFENNANITYQEGGDALGREYHGWIAAFDKTTGERIGYVDYSYYQGKTAVKMIEVFPEFQHKGYGMMLLNKLQERAKNPITIQGNYATKEGAALFKKFKKSRKSDSGLNEAAGNDGGITADQAIKQGMSVEEWIGQLPVAYHGTNEEFDKFEIGRKTGAQGRTSKHGLWFTDDKEEASQYAKLAGKRNYQNQERYEAEIEKIIKKSEYFQNKGMYDEAEKLMIKAENLEIEMKSIKPKEIIKEAIMPTNLLVHNAVEVFNSDEMDRIIDIAKKDGYVGVKFRNIKDSPFGLDKNTTQYVIFNPNEIKTKSQLLAEYKAVENKLGQSLRGINEAAENDEDLLAEARKYKTADGFVASQGITVYRGTVTPQTGELKVANTYGLAYGKGAYFAGDKNFAKSYGSNLVEYQLKMKNPLIMDAAVPDSLIARAKKDLPQYADDFKTGMSGEDFHGAIGNADEANEYLQSIGIDGLMNASGKGYTSQHILFDPSQIKTKFQLIDIWNKAHGELSQSASGINEAVRNDEALLVKARKYKTVEEFVSSRIKLFRGGDLDSKTGIYLTDDKDLADSFGVQQEKETEEFYVELNNPKRIVRKGGIPESSRLTEERIKQLKDEGFDGFITTLPNGKLYEVVAFDKSQVKTKSQLIDIWKKAHSELRQSARGINESVEIGDGIEKLRELAKQYNTPEEFINNILIHGTNLPRGTKIDYIEPQIGDFTRMMYAGAGDGTFEEMGGKPLAYYKTVDSVEKIKHYAMGVSVYPKHGDPYVLIAERPSDALIVKEDGVYDFDNYLVSRDIPLGAETGDIISEEGSQVIAQIPLKDFPATKQALMNIYNQSKRSPKSNGELEQTIHGINEAVDLLKEARKYKTVDEFVNAQEKKIVDKDGFTNVGNNIELYHGTSARRANKISNEGFRIRAVKNQTMGGDPESHRNYIWFAKKEDHARRYSEMYPYPKVITVRIPKDVFERINRRGSNSGPDSFWSNEEIPPQYIYRPEQNKAHLIDIWNKAQGQSAYGIDEAATGKTARINDVINFVKNNYSKIDNSKFKINYYGNTKTIVQGTKLGDIIDNPSLFEKYPSLKNMKVFISVNRNNQNTGISTSSGEISIGATSIKQAEITLNHEIAHRVLHIEGLNELSLTGEIDNYSDYINRPDEKAIREMDKSKLTHKNDGIFGNFVESLKNSKNEFLIEAILEGYKAIFESIADDPKNGGGVVMKEYIDLYRGMDRKFDSNFDLSKTDAPQGYSTWTDNVELAKQYAGKNGYIYKIRLPIAKLGKELIDENGERVLFVDNEKKAGLNNISGKEYLVYTQHDEYSPSLISKFSPTTTKSELGQSAHGINESVALLAEAKKHKTFDDFIRAQGVPVHHGGDKPIRTIEDINLKNNVFYTLKRTDMELDDIKSQLTPTSYYSFDELAKMPAKAFGKEISDFVVNFKNPKIIDAKGKNWLEISDGKMSDWTNRIIRDAIKSGKIYDGIIIKNIEEGFSGSGVLGANAGLVDDYIVLDKSTVKTKSHLVDIWKKAHSESEKTELFNKNE